MPHLVGTNLLLPSLPSSPADSNRVICASPIDASVSSPIASAANRSSSLATESTFLGMLAWPTTSARSTSPEGPRGVLMLSKVGLLPTIIGLAKSSSTSTLLSAMAISWVVSSMALGDAVLLTGITLPPVTRLAWRAATSSSGLPNRSAGSPLVRGSVPESSGTQVALGPVLTSG